MVDMEFEPNGMVEKPASGLRFVERAVQADFARFKAHVEMGDAEGIEYRSSGNGAGADNEDDAVEPPPRSSDAAARPRRAASCRGR